MGAWTLMKNITCKRGFTLLEIMIALTIFAIAAIVCLNGYLVSSSNIKSLSPRMNNSMLARWKVEELRTEDREAEEGEGIFPQPFEEYEWRMFLSDEVITDTEYGVLFIPYKVSVSGQKSSFETIVPFIKSEAGGE